MQIQVLMGAIRVQIRAIAANVIKEAIRQKIIYVTVLFALLLFAIEPMIPSFKVGLRVQLFGDIALGIAYLAIAVIAIAISVNQVPKEIERRTIYNIFSKPVRRTDFLVGKYLGVLVVLAICASLMGVAIFGFIYVYFGKVAYGIFQGVGMMLLEASLISAFATLVSTLVSPTINVFACILFYFMGHVKNDALANVIKDGSPASTLGLALKYTLPSLENFNVSEAVARSVILKANFILGLLLYALVFIIIFLTIASFFLRDKEL